MKLIALSDTHLKTGKIPPQLQTILEACDLIIHAGDFSTVEAYEAFKATGKLKAVYGNADAFEIRQRLPERLKFEVEGVKIGVIHEGGLSIMDTTAQGYLAKEMEVDVLIFGHLHRPLIEKKDVMLICPGSPTKPRMSNPSVVELIIEKGVVTGRILTLEGDLCGYMQFRDALKEREKEKGKIKEEEQNS
ncbi:metallophosphoesterase [Methanosarcina sp. KYL-1]|uniref:metallophosphoesterase n=1 Tax=Methanosarcina sp. KYL-1 TaxID=2602068 RepID=UPI0021006AF8|nr:metallophosphoesterase [Methanosarcina sp. KYL-1]MCQ1535612.1 metallophosphoesterase [Methanosarcina sp. KYL-1]